MRAAAAAVAGGLLLVGCAPPPPFADPEAMAEALGCSESYEAGAGEPLPGAVGTCTVDGEEVRLVVADDPPAAVEAAEELSAALDTSGFGATMGHGWAVLTTDQELADALAERLENRT